MRDSYYLPDRSGMPSVSAYLSYNVLAHSVGQNSWYLSRIAVMRGNDTGKGLGTELLTKVCAVADAEQATLMLGVDPDEPQYFNRLVDWYSRHGFKPVGGWMSRLNNVMVREPERQDDPLGITPAFVAGSDGKRYWYCPTHPFPSGMPMVAVPDSNGWLRCVEQVPPPGGAGGFMTPCPYKMRPGDGESS